MWTNTKRGFFRLTWIYLTYCQLAFLPSTDKDWIFNLKSCTWSNSMDMAMYGLLFFSLTNNSSLLRWYVTHLCTFRNSKEGCTLSHSIWVCLDYKNLRIIHLIVVVLTVHTSRKLQHIDHDYVHCMNLNSNLFLSNFTLMNKLTRCC